MRHSFVILATLMFGHSAFSAEQEDLMGAPSAMVAYNHQIDLLFPSVECGPTYRIEASFDKRHWEIVREGAFVTMGEGTDVRCMRDFIDSKTRITKQTKALYYRYAELKDNKIIRRSEIGKVTAKELESYWDKDW